MDDPEGYAAFVHRCRRRLWLAVVPIAGPTIAEDAVSEALAWAWQNWDRTRAMENPEGYLYRIAQRWASKQTVAPTLPAPPPQELPDVEPALIPALARLTQQQRTVVWLVEGCGWGLTETGGLLGLSISTVRTHLSRALDHLRNELEVDLDAPR